MICAACCCDVEDQEECLHCAIEHCGKIYHTLCAGGNSSKSDKWICPECRCAAKRGGDNSSTPVGSTKMSRDTFVTMRNKVKVLNSPPEDSFISDTNDVMKSEIQYMRQEMLALRAQVTQAVSLLMIYEGKMDDYCFQIKELNSKLEAVVTRSTIDGPPLIQSTLQVATDSQHAPSAQAETSGLDIAAAHVSTKNVTAKPRKQKKKVGKNNIDKIPLVPLVSLPNSEAILTPTIEVAKQLTNKLAPRTEKDTEATKKRSERPKSLCGTADSTRTTLKAVEPRRYMHLWNMESNADDIKAYLRELCPSGVCTVQELTPRGDYKSYKIGVPTAFFDMCFSTDVWPVNAKIKPWVTFKKPMGQLLSAHGTDSFRNKTTTS